jgi:SAM-dependent methyltransferase
LNKYLVVADQILRNAVMGLPPVARWRSRVGRTSPRTTGVDAAYLERYAYAPFDLVARTVGDACEGLTVGEIGPGDHIPAALLFLADGAARYVAFDRFAGAVDDERAREVYRALGRDLRERRPLLAAALAARGIDADRFPAGCGDAVRHVACAFEQADEVGIAPLDVIFSHNVLEHVLDIERIAHNAWALLRPGGLTVHRVDFGPHNPWRQRANPFEWLTVPEATWRMMGSQRGIPNRKRFHEVVAPFEQAGFEVRADVVERFGRNLVDAMRPGLAPPFRDMPPESLDVRTAILVGLKP